MTTDQIQQHFAQNGFVKLSNFIDATDLNSVKQIALEVGDVLLFSANMIHRGLYAKNRLTLDLLYCERSPQ